MGKHGNERHGTHHIGAGHEAGPYWKRAHRSWIFWVGALLTFAAILTYVMSMDLAWRPRVRATQPPQSSAAGK